MSIIVRPEINYLNYYCSCYKHLFILPVYIRKITDLIRDSRILISTHSMRIGLMYSLLKIEVLFYFFF